MSQLHHHLKLLNRTMKKQLLIFGIMLTVIACGNSAPEETSADLEVMTPQERVEHHLQQKDYAAAFDYIDATEIEEPLRTELLLATHMTHAWELTHGEVSDQRTRMPAALRHLRRALELDPGNASAVEQIELIEGIYRSLNRDIPDGVAEDRASL